MGDKVTYTVTVAQHGKGAVKDATVVDDLAKVLDDAAYNDDAKASSGEVEVKDGTLTWTGDLPVGGKATITYSVTVTGKGDRQLHNVVTAPGPRGSCQTEKACQTDHPVTPEPGEPTPGTPRPGEPTPGTPGPEQPDPGNPQPGNPKPGAPGAGGQQPSGPLASTGTAVLTVLAAAAALLSIGGIAVALTRRRCHGH